MQNFFYRYALQLTDTIVVGQDQSALLTEGTKSTKDTLFFLNDEPEVVERKEKKPAANARANGSPAKKTAGTKILRGQTRRAAQDEVHQTAAAKLLDHQKELHDKLQDEGLRRYSEDGVGTGVREGKTWKKFQSYKGEAALPQDVDRLRVRYNCCLSTAHMLTRFYRFTLTGRPRLSFCQSTALPCLCMSTP